MEKAKRQKFQANSQSIMIIWAKIQQNNVSFHLAGTATFLAFPRLDFKGRSLETETSSRWRELGNERLFLSLRRWPSSISIKKFFQLNLKLKLFFFASFRMGRQAGHDGHGFYLVRRYLKPFLSSHINRAFYRYGGHIELIRFKEYYRMPRGHEHISFVFSSAFRDIFS